MNNFNVDWDDDTGADGDEWTVGQWAFAGVMFAVAMIAFYAVFGGALTW